MHFKTPRTRWTHRLARKALPPPPEWAVLPPKQADWPFRWEETAPGVKFSIIPTQDGRPLRRYRRRWKVERLFAWLQNYRRILTRFEYHPANYLGFVHLGCILILLRCYL